MSDIFISHVEEDERVALEIAQGLEAAGYQTWYYERDSDPGPSYLLQADRAIEGCRAIVIIISPSAMRSRQMTVEVVRGHEGGKPFVPVRYGISHVEFQERQREWRFALGASATLAVPSEDVASVVPRIVRGLQGLDIHPIARKEEQPRRAASEGVAERRATPTPSKAKVELPPKDMVRIPAGEFSYDDKKAKYTLPEYYIDVYPVTNEEYKRFVEAGGYKKKEYWTEEGWSWIQKEGHKKPTYWGDKGYEAFNRPDHPVVGKSWYEAWAYAKWAGKRLPTELEWEKAARGVDGLEYPWGDAVDSSRCNTNESKIGSTTPVTRYETGKSPYGCYDMAGNVLDWTSSLVKDYPYEAGDGREDPKAKGSRVLRGGSWYDTAEDARTSTRYWNDPVNRLNHLGFRCAKTP